MCQLSHQSKIKFLDISKVFANIFKHFVGQGHFHVEGGGGGNIVVQHSLPCCPTCKLECAILAQLHLPILNVACLKLLTFVWPRARSHLHLVGPHPSHASLPPMSSRLHLHANSSSLGTNVTEMRAFFDMFSKAYGCY